MVESNIVYLEDYRRRKQGRSVLSRSQRLESYTSIIQKFSLGHVLVGGALATGGALSGDIPMALGGTIGVVWGTLNFLISESVADQVHPLHDVMLNVVSRNRP